MTKKAAALAAVLALTASIPTAAVSADLIQLPYDLPDDLLAFIAGTPPDHDFAVGSGRFAKGQPADAFNISAHGRGSDVTGHVHLRLPDGTELRGDVDCLAVAENVAGISGFLDEPADEERPRFIVGLKDNGEPQGVAVDEAFVADSTHPLTLPECGLGTLLNFAGRPILQGNIVVRDR